MRHRLVLASLVVGSLAAACGSGAADQSDSPTATPLTATDTDEPPAQTAATSSIADSESSSTFACTPAPADLALVETFPEWSLGTVRHLVVEIFKDLGDGVPGSSSTPVTLTVADDTAAGWGLLWESASSSIADLQPPPGAQEAFDSFIDELPRERIEYGLDASRTIGSIDNIEEMRANNDRAFELLGETGVFDAETLTRTKAVFDGMSDEDFAQFSAERVLIYHILEGYELDNSAPIEFADQLPNPFGPEPFPATTTIEVSDVVDADGCMTITQTVLPDPDEFPRIVAESLQAAGLAPEGEQFEQALAAISIENRIVAQYDAATGFLWRVTASQTIGDGAVRRLEIQTITDVTSA